MKGYIVCVYESIENDDALKSYASKAREAIEKYNGKILVRGGKKISTEGNDFVRTAVIEFSSFDEANKFYNSEEYQDAHLILKGSAIRQHQIVEGC